MNWLRKYGMKLQSVKDKLFATLICSLSPKITSTLTTQNGNSIKTQDS